MATGLLAVLTAPVSWPSHTRLLRLNQPEQRLPPGDLCETQLRTVVEAEVEPPLS